MLYIASALTPTPILGSLRTISLTDNHTSLVVAKPNKIEVWDVTENGLVWRSEIEVWGTVVGIDQVSIEDSRPHILILLAPPQAHLLLVTFEITTSKLIITSSTSLTPPTPTLRQAEFFTAVVAQERVALVSLWIGVLSCLEIELDKGSSGKKKRSSTIPTPEGETRLKIKDNFNINIREHNLLHLSFLPPTINGPVVTLVWLSASNGLRLQARFLSLSAHSFNPLSKSVDLVSPTSRQSISEDSDFNAMPFSCPAARRVVPIPSELPNGQRTLLVIGDEHSVLYTLGENGTQSPKAVRRMSAVSGPTSSPRANARRSPQTELSSGNPKRRKSSMGTKTVDSQNEEFQWDLRPVWRSRQGFGTVIAATVIEDHGSGASVVIGDEYGAFTALGWEFEKGLGAGMDGRVRVLRTYLGASSPPSSITYLDSSHLFVSSAVADSVLLRLPTVESSTNVPSGKGKGREVISPIGDQLDKWEVLYEIGKDRNDTDEGLEILERWMNIAPVKDLCAVKDEGGNLSHLVLASGASESNSLRVVRSGVGLEELVTIQGLHDVQKMWSLTDSTAVPRLLLSTSTSTVLLQLQPEISVIPIVDVIFKSETLAAGILPGAELLAQVTPRGLSLWSDLSVGQLEAQMKVDKGTEIVCAQVTADWAVVAKKGGNLVVFHVSDTGFSPEGTIDVKEEVSAVAISNSSDSSSPIIVIATWTAKTFVYTLSQISNGVDGLSIPTKSSATSLQLRSHPFYPAGIQLLSGLDNGLLHIHDLDTSDSGDAGELMVKSSKSASLGLRPLVLHPCESTHGDEKVISVGLTERMSVIFESKGRVEFSSVNIKNIMAATAVNTSSGPVFALFSRTSGLSLVKINSLKKLHVQTCDTGNESVSKLTYMDEYKAVACGLTRRTQLRDGDVEEENFVQIRDGTSLEPLSSFSLRGRELVTSLRSVFLTGSIYLAVGTGILPPDDGEDSSWDEGNLAVVREGRVLLLEFKEGDAGSGWDIKVKAELATVGAVYALEEIHGFLAVAAGSKLTIHRLDHNPVELEETSSWASAYVISSLSVLPPSLMRPEGALIVGDGMRSVIVLNVDEGDGMIYDDERNMATHGVTALGLLKDKGDGVVISDAHSNLLTYRLNQKLERAATFGLHEEVTRFQSGSLVPTTTAPEIIIPDVLFATREGRLGIIGELGTRSSRTLDDLQRNMSKIWKGPGEVGWSNWRRAGSNLVGKDTAGFVDGDFVQKFLDTEFFDDGHAQEIIQGTSSHEHVRLGKEEASRADVVRFLEATAGMH
ncbi:DNA damage-binding protein 1 [Cryptococcus neoformans C23]|nr:DNA damage-binding protein 1 [Cryptococcus neoformans var. grubii C23]